MLLVRHFLFVVTASVMLCSGSVLAEQPKQQLVSPPMPIASPLLSAEDIVDSIALCIRAVQPENNLALGEFDKAGWRARTPITATDQNGNRYKSYTFRKADALSAIRVYETRPVCSVHVENVHDAKKAKIENLLLANLGGIPSEQQNGFDNLKAEFLNEAEENGGWGNVAKQLSEQLYFFKNAAVTVEMVEIANTRAMVTNTMAIQNAD